MSRTAFASFALTAIIAAPGVAQIPATEYAVRRDSVAARVKDGVVVALGGRTPVTDFGPFYQLPAFHYLTNFHEPDAAMVLVAKGGKATTTLFLTPIDPRTAFYYGRRPDSAAVEQTLGMKARSFAALAGFVDSLARSNPKAPIYTLADFGDADFSQQDSLTRGGAFMKGVAAKNPGLTMKDGHDIVDLLRAKKSPAEMALLRKAGEISAEGHRAAMTAPEPAHEYEIQAAVEYTFMKLGGARPSYGSIVGAGQNGTQLHYMKDRGRAKPGDVIVIDAGTEYEGYAADVTRTIPVSGTFTPAQRALYTLVYDAQLAAERNSKAGMSAKAAVDSSIAIRAKGLVALGLAESEDATFDPPWKVNCTASPNSCKQTYFWMIHGISHGIGLAVHDPAQFYSSDNTFREGDAFTIEPGIYVSQAMLDALPDTPKNRAFKAKVKDVVPRYENTGVRIEDSYIITDKGLERISSNAPRQIDEVEALIEEALGEGGAVAGTTPAPRAGRREWIGLGVLALPCLLYSMDLTVLNLAVPAISAELKPSSAQLLWIVDIYGFLVAGSLMTMGTLGDRVGRRRLLLIGAAAFGVGSVLAAFSRSAEMLIATRALLGLAGATLAPSTLSLIRNMFLDPDQRTFAIGVWISSYSAGAAIGPLVGGFLLGHFWWGSVFLIGVPVMLILLAAGPFLLPEFRDPNAARLDVVSALLSLTCILAIIYGVKQFAQDNAGWLATVSVVAGLALGIVFVRRQLTLADPLIDLRMFRVLPFTVSLGTYTLGTFVAFGIFVFITQYLQLVLDLSPLRAGLATLPFALAFIFGSLITPRLARRFRPGSLIAGGLLLGAVGFGLLTQVGPESGATILMVAVAIYALGLSPTFTLATDMLVGSAPPERAGVASALSETGSELGGALGIAIIGSIGTALYRSELTSSVSSNVPLEAVTAARSTLGEAVATAARLPEAIGSELTRAATHAFTDSLRLTALVCAILTGVLAISVAALLRNVQARPHDAT